MMSLPTFKKRGKALILLLALLGLVLAACMPRSQAGSEIALGQGIVYATSSQGKVFAINPESRNRGLAFPGEGEWVFPQDKGLGLIYARPLPTGDTLYVATFPGEVLALDPATGVRKREGSLFQQKKNIVATPVFSPEGNLLLIAAGEELHAIDPRTGNLRWPKPFRASDRIWASPILGQEEVIFGAMDGHLYAVSLRTGTELWSFESEGGIAASPTLADSVIYAGSFGGKLYALDRTGGLRWDSPLAAGQWIWTRPLYYQGKVYFGTLKGKFYAVDATSGQERWRFPEGEGKTEGQIRSSPVLAEGIIVVATTQGTVYGLDPDTGNMVWRRTLAPGSSVTADLLSDQGNIYIATREGTVYALDAKTGKEIWNFSLKG